MKNVILLLVAILLTGCFADDYSGSIPGNPYSGQTYVGSSTEYCRFDPTQDVFTPYVLNIPVSSGNLVVVNSNDLEVNFNGNGTQCRIKGSAKMTSQTTVTDVNIDITAKGIDLANFTLFGQEICIGNTNDLYTSNNVTGEIISDTDVMVLENTRFYVNESAAYKNGQYVRGIILLTTVNGVSSYGQIVLE